MNYITSQQTPVYRKASNGFYVMVRSLASGTNVVFASTGMDDKSGRAIGILATGEIMYLDTLTKVLDDVMVKDSRLWDWLLYAAIGAGTIYYITK